MRATRTAPAASLTVFGGICAVTGGALRVASTFISWAPASPWLEMLYGVIDVCLLFGLIAVYLRTAERIGIVGLSFFVISLAAEASIVGPDAVMFGIDFYRLGCAGLLVGLLGLSLQMLRVGVLRAPAGLWLASAIVGFCSNATGSKLGLLAAGAILGAGFLCAGVLILQRPHLTAAAG